jgi:hypothetical protein
MKDRKASLWPVTEARVLGWDIGRIEVKCELKLNKDAKIKTPDGKMPSGWEISKGIYYKTKGGDYKRLRVYLAGTEDDRNRYLRSLIRMGRYFAMVPALDEQYGGK